MTPLATALTCLAAILLLGYGVPPLAAALLIGATWGARDRLARTPPHRRAPDKAGGAVVSAYVQRTAKQSVPADERIRCSFCSAVIADRPVDEACSMRVLSHRGHEPLIRED